MSSNWVQGPIGLRHKMSKGFKGKVSCSNLDHSFGRSSRINYKQGKIRVFFLLKSWFQAKHAASLIPFRNPMWWISIECFSRFHDCDFMTHIFQLEVDTKFPVHSGSLFLLQRAFSCDLQWFYFHIFCLFIRHWMWVSKKATRAMHTNDVQKKFCVPWNRHSGLSKN